MLALTEVQSDAILDVIDECRRVSDAWGRCKHRSILVQEAIEKLDEAYISSRELGVTETVILGVIARNLPEAVIDLMNVKPAA